MVMWCCFINIAELCTSQQCKSIQVGLNHKLKEQLYNVTAITKLEAKKKSGQMTTGFYIKFTVIATVLMFHPDSDVWHPGGIK